MTIVDYVASTFHDSSDEFKKELINTGRLVKIEAGEEIMSIG